MNKANTIEKQDKTSQKSLTQLNFDRDGKGSARASFSQHLVESGEE
jgi:hypothetical protein